MVEYLIYSPCAHFYIYPRLLMRSSCPFCPVLPLLPLAVVLVVHLAVSVLPRNSQVSLPSAEGDRLIVPKTNDGHIWYND
jgi:hypothetical protein